jgi:cytidine deaminase
MALEPLIRAAAAVRRKASAPYSRFKVGAALEDAAGRVYTGCNVESSSYGLTICAERNAVFHAVAKGARRFRRIVVCADTTKLTPPCGACRQVLWEQCGDIEVILVNPRGKREQLRMKDLLPRAFDGRYLD